MSLDALMRLRDDVTAVLSNRAERLQAQLAALTGNAPSRGVPKSRPRRSKLAGRKVAPKYRDRSGNTWSGRGAQPRWMTAAIKGGAKRDDFLIAKTAARKRKTRG
jgi:DNA-binding protein H-NS